MDTYITPKAAASELAVSVKMIYKLAVMGELEALKIGRAVRILAASLREFVVRNTVQVEETSAPLPQPTPHPRPQRKPSLAGFVFLPPRS